MFIKQRGKAPIDKRYFYPVRPFRSQDIGVFPTLAIQFDTPNDPGYNQKRSVPPSSHPFFRK